MNANSLIDAAFSGAPNPAMKAPTASRLEAAPPGTSFETRAFAALFLNASSLNIRSVHRCRAARVDGFITLNTGEIILVEMKESLRWGSTQSATFQFLAGRDLLGLRATRGILIFEKWSAEWERIQPFGAWGQLALHASEVGKLISIGAMRLRDQSFEMPPTHASVSHQGSPAPSLSASMSATSCRFQHG